MLESFCMWDGIVSVGLQACIPFLVTLYAPMQQNFAKIIALEGTKHANMLHYKKNALNSNNTLIFLLFFYQNLKCLLAQLFLCHFFRFFSNFQFLWVCFQFHTEIALAFITYFFLKCFKTSICKYVSVCVGCACVTVREHA